MSTEPTLLSIAPKGIKSIEVITHYGDDDTECSGDYYSIQIKINNKEVASFGDHYHDKGAERAEEWLNGLRFAVPNLPAVKETDKASGRTG